MARANRTRRVSEAIAQRIKKQIASGRLKPGRRLPAERELAERLSTSRVSVREAYRSLEELGLIQVRRGAEGGAFIADVDHEPVSRSLSLMLRLGRTSHEELTEARLLIEPPVARLAARRASSQDVERLRELVRRQDEATRNGSDARQYDLEFHRLVARSAQNLPLMLVMNSVADLVVEAISPIRIQKPARRNTIGFHARILDAIGRRDEEAAHEIMREHVLEVQSRLGRSLAKALQQPRRGARARRARASS